ncbi:MAG: hypothetical protein QNJ97_13465 [Myxococcota bacterium]|nr:hypothetical protein [Myxococcota bacterium]
MSDDPKSKETDRSDTTPGDTIDTDDTAADQPFATEGAPWVGAEKRWLTHLPEATGEPELADPPEVADKKSDLVAFIRESSIPPSVYGPDSLPALAATPPKSNGAHLKLGIIAIVLAVLIFGAAFGWWFIEVRNQAATAQETAASLTAQLADRDSRIEALKNQIEHLKLRDTLAKEQQTTKAQLRGIARPKQGTPQAAVATDALHSAVSTPVGRTTPDENKDATADPAQQRVQPPLKQIPDDPYAVRQADTLPMPVSEIPDDPYDEVSTSPIAPGPSSAAVPTGFSEPDDPVADLIDNSLQDQIGQSQEAGQAGQKREEPAANTTPTRAQVKTAMSAVAPSVKRCGNKAGERIVLKIAVSGETGRVVSAETVSPEHVGTPVGLCAVRAVRHARFPKFSQKLLVVKYPFDL